MKKQKFMAILKKVIEICENTEELNPENLDYDDAMKCNAALTDILKIVQKDYQN